MTLPNDDPYVFERIEVGGVPVHVKHWPTNQGCHFRIIFHVGARHDPEGKEGLAHLFEQRCFCGWIPDLSRMTEAVAFLSSFVSRPLLDQREFNREIGVIEQEIWKDFANQKQIDFVRETRQLIYPNHPFGRQARTYGWPSTVSKLTRENCLVNYAKYYHRGNCEIVLAGNISVAEASIHLWPL